MHSSVIARGGAYSAILGTGLKNLDFMLSLNHKHHRRQQKSLVEYALVPPIETLFGTDRRVPTHHPPCPFPPLAS